MDPIFRRASLADLPSIVELLADDELGRTREDPSLPLNARYVEAFAAIDRDANQLLVVGVRGETIVGCMQLTFIPGLSRLGMWRALIESVRVAGSERARGFGRAMFEWAFGECRRRGCELVQLTTDKRREDARRFYEALGFEATHEGMKKALEQPTTTSSTRNFINSSA
jgi:GNAT superfamily N-acetyltransferase